MKKLLAIGAAATLAVTGSGIANALPPGDVPTNGEFHYIDKYYNGAYQLVGYDIHYCDGSVETYREPGENLIYFEVEEGTCFYDPFPF